MRGQRWNIPRSGSCSAYSACEQCEALHLSESSVGHGPRGNMSCMSCFAPLPFFEKQSSSQLIGGFQIEFLGSLPLTPFPFFVRH